MTTLTKEEQDIYDRQIRIWGLDFQQKLANVSVLVIGCKILGQEFCKNILLGGIRKVTLMDDEIISPSEKKLIEPLITLNDIGLKRCEALQNNCRTLNPFAVIETIDEFISISDISEEKIKSILSGFDYVVSTLRNSSILYKIEKHCLNLGIPFMIAMGYSEYGFMFNGSYQKILFPTNIEDKDFFMKFASKKYPPSCLKMLKLFHPNIFKFRDNFDSVFSVDVVNQQLDDSQIIDKKATDVSGPVGSVVGAVMAQELFKVLGNGLEPIDNYFHYDMSENVGVIIKL